VIQKLITPMVAAALAMSGLSLGQPGVSRGEVAPGFKAEQSSPYMQLAALTKASKSTPRKSGKG
jgi:hypothetical protein